MAAAAAAATTTTTVRNAHTHKFASLNLCLRRVECTVVAYTSEYVAAGERL